ncbi:RES domain-containing protein [Rhodococcus sp. HM1]|nr:RES domain-containing protein [Rhodococcus sp. HM1]
MHHSRSQHWARTIHRAHRDLDGIIYRGRLAGATSIALFERAADAFVPRPELSRPLLIPRSPMRPPRQPASSTTPSFDRGRLWVGLPPQGIHAGLMDLVVVTGRSRRGRWP